MDHIFNDWLKSQHESAMKLSAESDVLTLYPEPKPRPQAFLARFDCPTMIKDGAAVVRTDGFDVLISFPDEYLRQVLNPALILTLLSPQNAYHPNVRAPFICVGDIAPGTGLAELIWQIFEIMTFQKLTPDENNALNQEACSWARNHAELFPLFFRPLRRREIRLDISELQPEPVQ